METWREGVKERILGQNFVELMGPVLAGRPKCNKNRQEG